MTAKISLLWKDKRLEMSQSCLDEVKLEREWDNCSERFTQMHKVT